jgi:hypothetical protein
VNEFLEAIATERNKIPSATHQEENPPLTNKERKYSESCLCKRSVQYYYLSGKREVCFHSTCMSREQVKPSLFQEITNDCCLPSTKLDETI